MNMFKKNGGFTLVELIVVIAILAILAGIAIPAYSGYIKKANDSAVETELTAISTAAMAAEATAGQLTDITVNKAGTTVTITGVDATKFASDFKAFYGKDATAGATAGTYTVNITEFDSWNGSSYAEKNGATWNPTTGWAVNE